MKNRAKLAKTDVQTYKILQLIQFARAAFPIILVGLHLHENANLLEPFFRYFQRHHCHCLPEAKRGCVLMQRSKVNVVAQEVARFYFGRDRVAVGS